MESSVIAILALTLLFSSGIAGYAKAYDVIAKETEKYIHKAKDGNEYIYLGMLNGDLILYSPCANTTRIERLSSDTNFEMIKSKWKFHC